MSWADVDAWKQRALKRRLDLNLELFRMEWVPLATDDGTYAARRVRKGDPIELTYWEGEPEATGYSAEVLLATVRAEHEQDLAERKAARRWRCASCGHEHEGARMANICIGCPCGAKPPPAPPKREEA